MTLIGQRHLLIVLAVTTLLSACADDAANTANATSPGMEIGEDMGDMEMPSPDAGVDMNANNENNASSEDMSQDLGSGQDMDSQEDMAPMLAQLQRCQSAPLPTDLPEEEWQHTRNKAITLASADHSSQDALTTTTHGTRIEGKFAYGKVSKDLEDERVEILIDDCSGQYRSLGIKVTDSDGRIAFEIPTADLPAPGVYSIYLRVLGDNSSARSSLGVYPPQTRLVVFDIDGTLTTKDAEIFQDAIADFFEPIYSGDVVPESREGAVEITALRAQQNYPLVYLTGRPYALTRITREWLNTQGFAPGNLHVTDESEQVLPTEKGVGVFKRDYLKSLIARGFILEAAYGNAETDIFAYSAAKVSPRRTFIAGPHGGKEKTQPLGEGYDTHLPEAKKEATPKQPFRR